MTRIPLVISFWFMIATYVIHILDESLLGGSFVEKIRQHWWPLSSYIPVIAKTPVAATSQGSVHDASAPPNESTPNRFARGGGVSPLGAFMSWFSSMASVLVAIQ
jgi:hypothetical protein